MRLAILALITCVSLGATAVRYDPVPVLTTSGACISGSYCPALIVPGATIAVCDYATCSTPVTTYTDSTNATSCPSYAPVTLPGSTTCISQSGPQGQFGFWATSNLFAYTITLPNGTRYGPFPLTAAAIVSGVSTFNTRSGAVTLTNADVTAATGQDVSSPASPTFAGLTVLTGGISSTNSSGYAFGTVQVGGSGGFYASVQGGSILTGSSTATTMMHLSDVAGSCVMSSANGLVCTGTQPVKTSSSPTFAGVTISGTTFSLGGTTCAIVATVLTCM